MKRDQPTTPDQWLDEIRLAIDDARQAKPFGLLTGQKITDGDLFHLAPLVCMKFRGSAPCAPCVAGEGVSSGHDSVHSRRPAEAIEEVTGWLN